MVEARGDDALALLEGVRVVDLTSTLAGPYGTLLLADLGADVVKVEAPDGDPLHDLGPRRSADMGAVFLNLNRNKRSIVLDLTTAADRDSLHDLCRSADVAVHNMRPGAAVRCGADAPSLRRDNPRLVHCAIRGFGQGPYGELPAYDDVIQAAGGLAAQQEWVTGEPRYVANAVADKVAGMTAALAISAALYRRERTGEGCAIDVPMFEAVTAFALLEHLYGRTFLPPLGEARYPRQASPLRRPFRTTDGWLGVVVYTNEHWRRFFALIERPDLADDPRFATLAARTEHLAEAVGLVEEALAGGPSEAWEARLSAVGIPARRYRTVEELFDDPHLDAVGFFRRYEHPSEGTLLQVPTPLWVDGVAPGPGRPAPRLGADTDAVLAERVSRRGRP